VKKNVEMCGDLKVISCFEVELISQLSVPNSSFIQNARYFNLAFPATLQKFTADLRFVIEKLS
jgi:hypothetical protein